MCTYKGIPDFEEITNDLKEWGRLKHEEGADIEGLYSKLEKTLKKGLEDVKKKKPSAAVNKAMPNSLKEIKKLRPKGPRKIWKKFKEKEYLEKLPGAFLARCIGCTMGSVVEFWPVEKMERWAEINGDAFPLNDYWKKALYPESRKYEIEKHDAYTKNGMDHVPADDDLVYTLIGLLIIEKYGPSFTVKEVGKIWKSLLPNACTAEKVALENLKKGVPAEKAAEKNNPYIHWIGADIRADPFGYAAPGRPEKAAEMAYEDACISHRREGIYGEMFFAAAIAASFAVKDPMEALKIGLTEIPKDCPLAKDIKWAFRKMKSIKNYRQGREAVEKRFYGMSRVHTNNNACLTVFGMKLGGKNPVKVLGETVAMGLDNDCTAATAGSLIGAICGRKKIPEYLTKPFNNKIRTYIKRHEYFDLDDIYKRFAACAVKAFG
ncbi:MAG: ADP-ribosylglycohydrolase family protein [Fibrobacterota bacterium]